MRGVCFRKESSKRRLSDHKSLFEFGWKSKNIDDPWHWGATRRLIPKAMANPHTFIDCIFGHDF
jgi:hypothetical protein